MTRHGVMELWQRDEGDRWLTQNTFGRSPHNSRDEEDLCTNNIPTTLYTYLLVMRTTGTGGVDEMVEHGEDANEQAGRKEGNEKGFIHPSRDDVDEWEGWR